MALAADAALLLAFTKPLPRKGMETVSEPLLATGPASALQNLFPERGWKPVEFLAKASASAFFTKPLPRKGMETRLHGLCE